MQKIYQNVDRMMKNRGYHPLMKTEQRSLYQKDNDKILISYYFSDKLYIETIKEFIVDLEKNKCHHGIIIYNNIITPSCKKVLEHIHQFQIELFTLDEFYYDITKHMFYCPHRKLESKETEKIKSVFGNRLPLLLKSDPISRYFFFQKHDVIEITRKNNSIAYRIVK